MSRSDTNRGLKIGLATLVGLAMLAAGVHKVIEYITPIGSASGYRSFWMSTEPTNTFSSAFAVLSDELQAAGFEVAPYLVSTNDLAFEYPLESAGGVERLQCISITRDTSHGFVLHWTDPIMTPPSNTENAWRSATMRYDLSGVGKGDMHYRDFNAFDRILGGVLETYREKTETYTELDSGE